MKKILIITPWFPPHGGSGVQRPLFFAKYLSEMGWDCIVLTTGEDDAPVKDVSLIDHIPKNAKIIRVKNPNLNIHLEEWCIATDRKIARFTSKIPLIWKLSNRLSKTTRLLFKPLIRLLNVPDSLVSCLPKFLRHGRRIILTEKPDIILSTSPPSTTHLAGYLLSKSSNIPWVADLRDEWTLNPLAVYPGAAYKALDEFLERITLGYAKKIISTTDEISRDTAIHINRDLSSFITITNGHTLEKVEPNNNIDAVNPDAIDFLYSGVLPESRSPATLIAAFSEIFGCSPKLEKQTTMSFAGDISLHKSTLDKPWIRYHGYLAHTDTLNSIKNTDVLTLIVGNDEKRSYAGKIFEYLAIGKPLLVLCAPDSATHKMFQEINGHIYLANINEVGEIRQQLELIYGTWQKNELPSFIDRPEAKKYHRRQLAKELDKVLNTIIGPIEESNAD